MAEESTIRGARLRHLKNITLSIPRGKLIVLTGISGSGKSTLAFDLLHTEALRQLFESIGMLTMGLRPSLSTDPASAGSQRGSA